MSWIGNLERSHRPQSSALMPSEDYTVSINLYIDTAPHDDRHITLTPGQTVVIGRASKSKEKNLRASSTNALFESPVVSRNHAELKAKFLAPLEDQVTITDKGSMHGTLVNGYRLEEGREMTLRNGDTLQFGERVSRGDEAHEGVLVRYIRDLPAGKQGSHTIPASNKFEVPEPSDDELSDADSDASVRVVTGREKETSSAQTTPEQAKTLLGSSQLPIDVDAPHSSNSAKIVHVEDVPQSTNTRNSAKVIQDSIDKDLGLYHTPSLRQMFREQDKLDDVANLSAQKLNVTAVLDDHEEASSVSDYGTNSEMDHSDDGSRDDLEELADYDDEARLDDDQLESDDDHIRLLDEDEEVEEPYSPKKQPSPELGSQEFATAPRSQPAYVSPLEASAFKPYPTTNPVPTNMPRYDPVRSSQPGQPLTWSTDYPEKVYHKLQPAPSYAPLPPPQGPQPRVPAASSYYPYAPISCNLSTGFGGASGWNVSPQPPADFLSGPNAFSRFSPPSPQMPGWQYVPPAFAPKNSMQPIVSKNSQPSSWPEPKKTRLSPTIPCVQSSKPNEWYNHPAFASNESMSQEGFMSYDFSDYRSPEESSMMKAMQKENAEKKEAMNKKIGIPNLVEAGAADAQASVEDEDVSGGRSRKRKADVMEQDEAVLAAEAAVAAEDELVVSFESVMPVPPIPNKKAKTEIAQQKKGSRVGEVAKVAGSALLGGVATMAFLCSPLAERALEWLA